MNGHVHDELPALLGGELPPSLAAAAQAYERARGDGGPRSSLLSQRTAGRAGRPYLADQLAGARRLDLDGTLAEVD
jgi:hypothetical protein